MILHFDEIYSKREVITTLLWTFLCLWWHSSNIGKLQIKRYSTIIVTYILCYFITQEIRMTIRCRYMSQTQLFCAYLITFYRRAWYQFTYYNSNKYLCDMAVIKIKKYESIICNRSKWQMNSVVIFLYVLFLFCFV